MSNTSAVSDRVPEIVAELGPSDDGAGFEIFRANSAAMCEIGLEDGQAASDFWFTTTIYRSPHSMAFRASSGGHTVRRGPEQIALGQDHIVIHVQVSGRSHTTCPDRRITVEPGDVVVYDNAKPHESTQAAYAIMVLTIPRHRVPPVFLARGVHGTILPAAEGAGRLVFRMLESLLDTAGGLSVAEFEAAVDGICTAAGGGLQARIAQASPERMLERAIAVIDRHIADPDLNPARIEEHLGLSRSSLYRLFAPEGGVGAVVLRRRLDRSLRVLLAGSVSRARYRTLAAENGFRSEAQLSRAFRQRFGVTPRALRDMVGRKERDGLAAQAQRAGFVTLSAWVDHVAGAAARDDA